VRRSVRFLVGVALGGGALAGYLWWVGVDAVLARATAVAPWALAAVVVLVVLEGVADGIGVWASVRPLGDGISPRTSVQFALAGDFFDILSPAGPVSSEPIMARFIGVATETTYSEALGVRGVAKYVKSGAQLAVSLFVAVAFLLGGGTPEYVLATLGGAVAILAVLGAALVYSRDLVSRALVVVLAPVVGFVSGLFRDDPHGRDVVERALDRFWTRVVAFRDTPGLLALVALGGVLEQVLTATAFWVALAGTGNPVALLPIVAIVPLPQAASVVPIPGSLGALDVFLAAALVAMTGVVSAAATAAVLVVRAVSLPFGVVAGGVCVAFLRGWRPGT
jgi:uncharacterized membrane protein YbhN (UPF0104 family)